MSRVRWFSLIQERVNRLELGNVNARVAVFWKLVQVLCQNLSQLDCRAPRVSGLTREVCVFGGCGLAVRSRDLGLHGRKIGGFGLQTRRARGVSRRRGRRRERGRRSTRQDERCRGTILERRYRS
jgi:hypothetical protein